jgi:hypothetical protein
LPHLARAERQASATSSNSSKHSPRCNAHLLRDKELPAVLQALPPLSELINPSRFDRALYKIRERKRLARLLYPASPLTRIVYRRRHLWAMLKRQLKSLFP